MKLPWDKENRNTFSTKLEYRIKSYPDGARYVVIDSLGSRLNYKINTYEDLWLLNQIHDVIENYNMDVEVTIPNLLDAQADRRFEHNQPHSLKLVCRFLNDMPHFRYKIFHPHNPEVVEALIDRVEIIDNSEFIKNVFLDLYNQKKGNHNSLSIHPVSMFEFQKDLILMSTDAGGFKPLMKLCDKLEWKGETFSASKSRTYENSESKLIQQIDREDFEGKDILIIDDICSKGGTFKGLSNLLRQRNCGKLFLAVSHMTIPDLSDDAVTSYFDTVYTTDSKYDDYAYDRSKGQLKIMENGL